MPHTTKTFSVDTDTATAHRILVQRPVRQGTNGKSRNGSHKNSALTWETVCDQHERLVQEIERTGITVLKFDDLLADALRFADARDWIIERRARLCRLNADFAAYLFSWLSDLPAPTLAMHLIEGLRRTDLPPAIQRRGPPDGRDWCFPALPHLTHLRDNARWLNNGVVLGRNSTTARRNEIVNLAAVLHFSPVFDEAYFDFWLASDSTNISAPPIDGRDVAMPGPRVCVGGITRNTSALALRQLAGVLFRKNVITEMLCLDLQHIGCESLDRCFVQVDRDCMLANCATLDKAPGFIIHAGKSGGIDVVERCTLPFSVTLSKAMAPATIRLIDFGKVKGKQARDALAHIDPIVLGPGQILAYEQHAAAFLELEEHGIKIAAVLAGSALMRNGHGPRSLVTVVHAKA